MEHQSGLPTAGGSGSIPLTPWSSRVLVHALASVGEERAAVLAAALAEDACLARWGAAARQTRGLPTAATAEQMAAWLGAALPELGRSEISVASPEHAACRSDLYFAWAAAGCARELSEPYGPEVAARASWHALLDEPGDSAGLDVQHVADRARRALASESLNLSEEQLFAAAERWRLLAPAQQLRWQAEDPAWAICLAGLWPAQARLAELEARFDEALRDARLTALKAFAYGAGHEINNPLANIASRAQALLAEEAHPERRRKLAAINAQAFRAHEMLADLMLFARPPEIEPQAVPLQNALAEVVSHFERPAAEQCTKLVVEQTAALTAWADPVQLKVALLALVQNALEAVAGGGQVTLQTSLEPSDRGPCAVISIHDTGPGVSSDALGRIFDPFYSGREAGRGLGFGLPKAWRIAAAHGGRLEALSELGRGATFRLWLPLSAAAGN